MRLSKEQRAQAKKARREAKLQRAIDKKTFKDQLAGIKVNTFTKAVVFIIVVVALIDLQLSYVLAFMDKIQIAEELSKQVCTTILGTVLVYMIRAYFDSRSEAKYGFIGEDDKSVVKNVKEVIGATVSKVKDQSGIDPKILEVLDMADEKSAPVEEMPKLDNTPVKDPDDHSVG